MPIRDGWLMRGARRNYTALAFAMALFAAPSLGLADGQLGAFGPEGPRMREQLWILPSGDSRVNLRATVFRPEDSAPAPFAAGHDQQRRPMVVINHGTEPSTRLSVSMPVFYWLSKWFVDRGYVVVLPQRRGHGATGGELAEARDFCSRPDHIQAGRTAADDIEAVITYMRQQSFIETDHTIIAGVSTGGWAALALAERNLPGVRTIVNFAGGRGAYANGRANSICGRDQLVAAAGEFGRSARMPTIWLYAENDTYFNPQIAGAMAKAWTSSGGSAELHLLPSYGRDGHALADDLEGWKIWGDFVDRFITESKDTPAIEAIAQHDAEVVSAR